MDRVEVIAQLRQFICTEIVKNPGLELLDDEPLITGGIIDSFSLAYIAVFIESAFGVMIYDTELTTQNMDTLVQMANRVLAG